MVLTALIAATLSTAPSVPARPLLQARATVRILSGARLRLGQVSELEGQRLRRTTVRTEQGQRPARLIEFE